MSLLFCSGPLWRCRKPKKMNSRLKPSPPMVGGWKHVSKEVFKWELLWSCCHFLLLGKNEPFCAAIVDFTSRCITSESVVSELRDGPVKISMSVCKLSLFFVKVTARLPLWQYESWQRQFENFYNQTKSSWLCYLATGNYSTFYQSQSHLCPLIQNTEV